MGCVLWPVESLDDQAIADVTDGARMLFGLILTVCSKRGRFPASGRALARALRLTDPRTVERRLGELARVGAIERYEAVGLDGVTMMVGSIPRYLERYDWPDGRRYPSKQDALAADPYPPRPGEVEKGWSADRRERETVEVRKEERSATEDRKNEERPGDQQADKERDSLSRGHAGAGAGAREAGRAPGKRRRGREVPPEQTSLPRPVEVPAEPPPLIRDAVLAWEAQLEEHRRAGEPVLRVSRRDLLLLAAEYQPEEFIAAVRHHLASPPERWHFPLGTLRVRCYWAATQWDLRPARPFRLGGQSTAPLTTTEDAAQPVEVVTPVEVLTPLEVVDVRPDAGWEEDWQLALRTFSVIEPWDIENWIKPLSPVGVTLDGVPVLAAPDISHVNWIRAHFDALIVSALGYPVLYQTYASSRLVEVREVEVDARSGSG